MSEQLDIEKMIEKGFKALYDKKGRKREEAFANGVRYANLQMWNLLKKYEKEIERLNNIINGIEKFMNEDYEYYEKYGYAEQGHAMGEIRRIKNKLQELKGDSSNEC